MKDIKIKRIRFLNFKSFRDKEFDFSGEMTVSGKNGTGKTTIVDGFRWCLFGKDSTDRKQFSVKTLDANGKAIPKIPHEVEICLEVGGESVVLCRRYNEKWKNLGSPNEVFIGHEEERIYNGIPLSVAEWKEKIDAIIPEDIFKYVTDPRHFVSQKPDVQRNMLFRMAGGVTDEEICSVNDDFRGLLSMLDSAGNGVGAKTMEEYKREIKANLSRIADEKKGLPERIDERKRDIVDPEDWGKIEEEIACLGKELSDVEDSLSDRYKAINDASEAKEKLSGEISKLRASANDRKRKLEMAAKDAYDAELMKKQRISNEMKLTESKVEYHKKSIDVLKHDIDDCIRLREALLSEYKSINSETLIFDDNQFVCPSCGRLLETDDIESKKEELTSKFNKDKAERLERNKEKGLAARAKIDDLSSKLELEKNHIEQYKIQVYDIEKQLSALNPIEPSYEELILDDDEYRAYMIRIEELKKQMECMPVATPDTELMERKRIISDKIDSLKHRLSKRDVIESNKKRIVDLERQLSELSSEEVRLKGIEFTMKEFSKTRSRMLSDKVNSLFSFVKFKLFDTQVNGEEVEVCEATVNGVPYSDVNNAGKILAGLDIIVSLQKSIGVSAPVFIDNAECISNYPNGLINQLGQVIFLRVTNDESLVIK